MSLIDVFFPAVGVVLIAGTVLFQRRWRALRRRQNFSTRKARRAKAKRYSFEGEFSPHAYSRLALLDEVTRRREEAGPMPRRSDTEITQEIQQRIAHEPGLREAGLEVVCRFGRVTLHGRVCTEEERTRARGLAHATPGVIDVSAQLRVEPRRTA